MVEMSDTTRARPDDSRSNDSRSNDLRGDDSRTVATRNDEEELRARALQRLKDKRGLMAHVLAYVMVHLLLVAVWFATGADFFWPIFPLFGWGIGLAFHTWDVLWPEPGPERVEAEMERLRRRRASGRPA